MVHCKAKAGILLAITLFFHPFYCCPIESRLYNIRVKSHRFRVRLAQTSKERSRGLMYVKSLAPHEGMFFVFNTIKRRNFWMKNVYISLDILFIDKNLKIQEIVSRAPPQYLLLQGKHSPHEVIKLTDEPFIVSSLSKEIKYVLELGGGRSEQLGLKKGDRLFCGLRLKKILGAHR